MSFRLTDSQTALLLGYYVGRDRGWDGPYRDDGLVQYAYSGYRVLAATDWRLHPRTVESRLAPVRRGSALMPDTPIWIVVADGNSAMYEKRAADRRGVGAVTPITVAMLPPTPQHNDGRSRTSGSGEPREGAEQDALHEVVLRTATP